MPLSTLDLVKTPPVSVELVLFGDRLSTWVLSDVWTRPLGCSALVLEKRLSAISRPLLSAWLTSSWTPPRVLQTRSLSRRRTSSSVSPNPTVKLYFVFWRKIKLCLSDVDFLLKNSAQPPCQSIITDDNLYKSSFKFTASTQSKARLHNFSLTSFACTNKSISVNVKGYGSWKLREW